MFCARPMLHQWNIRSRAHQCAVTGRPFEDGEKHLTAIYFDEQTGEYTRRDVSMDGWEQELQERKPFSFWKTVYAKNESDKKGEITPKENPLDMLQRMIEEGDPSTENARYFLAVMLERKRVLAPKDWKDTEEGRMVIYENKKTGEVFMIRDPELRLNEVEAVQEEVAFQLGFAGPAIEAEKVAGIEAKTKSSRKKAKDAEAAPAPTEAKPADTEPVAIVEEQAPTVEDANPDPSDLSDSDEDEDEADEDEADEDEADEDDADEDEADEDETNEDDADEDDADEDDADEDDADAEEPVADPSEEPEVAPDPEDDAGEVVFDGSLSDEDEDDESSRR